MKKFFGVLFLSFMLLLSVNAQNKFAIKAGYNYSFVRASYAGIKQPYDAKSGFNLAALIKIPFEGKLHFSPFAGYSMRGFTIKPKTGTIKKEQFTLHYLDLVPALSLDLPMQDNSLVISFGPQMSLTNFGSLKVTDENDATTSGKIKFGFAGYGWFDFGFNSSVAYHMKKMFVELGYYAGTTSINNNEEFDDRNIRNRSLSLNLGYYIK